MKVTINAAKKALIDDVSTADLAAINAVLAQPGSVVRGLALVVLDLANGVIPIKPATPYTKAQLANLIRAKMRNGS